MVEFNPTLGYLFLVLNGIFLIAIGITARRTQVVNSEDYEVSGRRVKWPLISGSLVVTMTWASTLLVASEAGYAFGWPTVWIYPISQVSVALMVPFWTRIRDALPRGTTFPEYVRLRFGKRVHILATLVTLSFKFLILFYLITGLGFGFAPLFGMEYWEAVVFGGIIIVAFTVLGGLWSSIMTDYFQYLILWTVVTLTFVFAIDSVGGLGAVYDNLSTQGNSYGYSILTTRSFYAYFLVYFFGWLFSHVGDQMLWQRMYAISETKDTGKAISLAFFTWCFLPAMGTLIGIIGLSAGLNPDQSSEILAFTIRAFAPEWLIIAFAFLVFNAIASTYGSMLVAFSSIITTDLYDAYIGDLTSDQKMKYDQYLVVGVGLTVIVLANLIVSSILQLSLFMGAFFVVVGVPIFSSFLWPRATERAVFASMLLGFIVALVLGAPVNYGMITSIGGLEITTWKLYAIMFFGEAIVVLVGTLIDPKTGMNIEDVGARARDRGEYAATEAPGDD
jgi:Na+/proline symporter